METREVRSLVELGKVAEAVLTEKPEGPFVITLSGELGAGKTAFVKEIAKLLGVDEDVTSPTFTIMRSYETGPDAPYRMLTHVDAYRIESDDEMRVLGFPEILRDTNRITCIEWPERISRLLPGDAHPVSLAITEGDTRTVTYGK